MARLARSRLLCLALLPLWATASAASDPPGIAGSAAVLFEYNARRVLTETNADARRPPASLIKLMTAEVVFHELKHGALSLDDCFKVSEHAWRTGGAAADSSTMFLPVGSTATVSELLQGLIVQSGNDAAIVLAEGIAGSVEAFTDLMNRRAKEIGLADSHFTNPHGLHDPEHWTTMQDLTTLVAHVRRGRRGT